MKITIFSSNQSRHLNLVKQLSQIADTVYFISETNTIFPGKVEDFFTRSEIMQKYFSKVLESEKKIFGEINFLPDNVKTVSIKMGDLNMMTKNQLEESLSSDLFIIFGASYIKGWLADFLVMKNAINIHMGISPYYRGNSCNFWALYDNNPGYVGATIHLLTTGLDSGNMFFHCIPKIRLNDSPFDFTMRSVLVAHNGLCESIKNKKLFNTVSEKQNKSLEIRYSKRIEFTDEVANEFLNRKFSFNEETIKYPKLLNPIFG